MAKMIRNMKELSKALEPKLKYALKQTRDIVNDCIQESINEYYKEKVFYEGTSATPEVYERTYKLMNSLVKTEIVKTGNTFSCQVKIDESYLNYEYPGNPDFRYNVPATGLDVLQWNAADGSHGGTVNGDWKIWDQAMTTLGGKNGIMSILITNLKKTGLPIK